MSGYSSFVVVWTLWCGVAVLLLTFVLLAVILSLRAAHGRQQRWRDKLVQRWRGLLAQAVVETPTAAPRLTRREATEILPVWGYYQEFLAGGCRDSLAQLARLSGLDLHAKEALNSGTTRQRLIGIQVLGSLRDRETRRLLRPLVRNENPYVSLAATHALLRISPRESFEELLPEIARRPDWPPARVIAMLREVGPDIVSEPLSRAIIDSNSAYQSLLVIYLETAHEAVALRTIKKLLLACRDSQVVATCLHQLRGIATPDSLKLLRLYMNHTDWVVQLHAVTGVGKLGTEKDIPALTQMLSHGKYWIRYRAAQALARIPTMTPERLQQLRGRQQDRFAGEILDQVLMEQAA